MEGVLDIDHPIRVDGLLRGRLTTTGCLVVGEGGRVEGQVLEVAEAIVKGTLTGNLKATIQVFLAASSKFRGTVETPRLIIEEGATAEFNPEIGNQVAIAPFPRPGVAGGEGGDTGTPEAEVAAGVRTSVRGGPPEKED